MSLETLKVWQRLLLISGSGVLGLFLLSLTSVTAMRGLKDDLLVTTQVIQAQRSSQRIQLRAQEIRAQLMLGLQHNPADHEILSLHDHPLSAHIEKMDKAQGELSEALAQLKNSLGKTTGESEPLLTALDNSLTHFLAEGVAPARQKLNDGHFLDANVLLLKKTNPSYEELRQTSVAMNDYVTKTVVKVAEDSLGDTQRSTWMIVAIGGVTTSLVMLLSILIARSVIRQLGGEPAAAIDHMHKVASGNLRERVTDPVPNSMLSSLNTMTVDLHGVIRKIQAQATELSKHSDEITQTANEVTTASVTEAEAISSMASAIEELTVSVSHLADMSDEAAKYAEQAFQLAVDGKSQVKASADEVGEIAGDVKQICEQFAALDESATQISSIAAVIKDIAGQTNLLALNAAIEAARAGESGRGFAVVADEVRKLAERTTLATGDIETMIASVQDKTKEIAGGMNSMLPQVERSNASALQATESLGRISKASEQILQRNRDAVNATREQREAATIIAQRVEQIAQMVEETSAAMKSVSNNAENTGELASVLKKQVGHFSV